MYCTGVYEPMFDGGEMRGRPASLWILCTLYIALHTKCFFFCAWSEGEALSVGSLWIGKRLVWVDVNRTQAGGCSVDGQRSISKVCISKMHTSCLVHGKIGASRPTQPKCLTVAPDVRDAGGAS